MPGIQSASYSLTQLAERGLLSRDAVNGMLLDTDLWDFAWNMVWCGSENDTDKDLLDLVSNADGFVVFVHGWTGSHAIWEELPALVVSQNPRLVSLVLDHNGFGETPFIHTMPAIKLCNPVGAMRAIERWIDLIQVRRQPGNPRPRVINFVGHSMGGAALFFLDITKWGVADQTRMAIAPALLLHDDLHRAFYTTLGLGIGLIGRLSFLEGIGDLISPGMIEVLAEGATQAVKDEHTRVYASTPKTVTARTFAAMGVIEEHPKTQVWDFMKVMLGHKDRLVGLLPMLNLLEDLHFDVPQIRVVLGTHYLFSLGDDMRRVHEQNRALVLHDIMWLHDHALLRQRTGA